MITIRELFKVTWSITKLRIAVRNADGILIHQFCLGEDCSPASLPQRLWWDYQAGKLTACNTPINSHNKPTRNGPEMGWGLEKDVIPPEILDAEVTILHMTSHDMIRYIVSVDIVMQELTLEMAKAFYTDREADQ